MKLCWPCIREALHAYATPCMREHRGSRLWRRWRGGDALRRGGWRRCWARAWRLPSATATRPRASTACRPTPPSATPPAPSRRVSRSGTSPLQDTRASLVAGHTLDAAVIGAWHCLQPSAVDCDSAGAEQARLGAGRGSHAKPYYHAPGAAGENPALPSDRGQRAGGLQVVRAELVAPLVARVLAEQKASHPRAGAASADGSFPAVRASPCCALCSVLSTT